MTGIAELHVAGLQVQHTAEERDKHIVLVNLVHAVVDGGDNLARRVVLRRQRTVLGTGDRHQKGRRNALAGNVPDAEMQFLVPDKEVVQVSSHFFGRHNGGRQVKVVPFGEGREDFGNHGHLNVAGHLEFSLHALLLLVQLGIGDVIHKDIADNENHQEYSQNLQQFHNPADIPDTGINLLFRNHDGKGPAGTLDRSKEHLGAHALFPDGQVAGLPGEHGLVQVGQGYGIISAPHRLLHGRTHHQRFRRAYHNLAGTADNHAEGIGIHFHIAHQFREPVQGNIGRKDGGNPAVPVPDGIRIGGHEHFTAPFVHIRF